MNQGEHKITDGHRMLALYHTKKVQHRRKSPKKPASGAHMKIRQLTGPNFTQFCPFSRKTWGVQGLLSPLRESGSCPT